MIRVQRFVNQLLSSNCYIVYDDETKKALIIDPGSEESKKEIDFIENNHLHPDYIILTHEHTDHNWGVNALKEKFPELKLICSELCDKQVKRTSRIFFSCYCDNPDYIYTIAPADILVKSDEDVLKWNEIDILFVMTPGHSKASICIDINGMLFTGDTIIPYPRYLNKKDGNLEEWNKSIKKLTSIYNNYTKVYPGHGDTIELSKWIESYY